MKSLETRIGALETKIPASLLDTHRRTVELVSLEARLTALEQAQQARRERAT